MRRKEVRMTKAELVEALKDFDDDCEVVMKIEGRGLAEDFLTVTQEDVKLIEGKELACVDRKLFDCSPNGAMDEKSKKLISLSGDTWASKRFDR